MHRYSDILLDHFMHPRHAGAMPDATGTGIARYPTCGDVTRVFVRVEDDVVVAALFQGSGCGPGIACASAMLEMVVGRPVESALALPARAVADAIQLPEPKMHCADLAVSALRAAIEDDRAHRAGGGEAR